MKQKRNKWVVCLNTKQRPSFARRRTHKEQEGKKWKKGAHPPPSRKQAFVLFLVKNKSLLRKRKQFWTKQFAFFLLFRFQVSFRERLMRAPRNQRESFLYWLGREKIDFVRTWGRCSLSSSPSPWLYIYLDGINVTLCVCVTEKVRVSSQNEERSARKARKCERDGHKLREGNKPPLPP